jgi:hypothetical protein
VSWNKYPIVITVSCCAIKSEDFEDTNIKVGDCWFVSIPQSAGVDIDALLMELRVRHEVLPDASVELDQRAQRIDIVTPHTFQSKKIVTEILNNQSWKQHIT